MLDRLRNGALLLTFASSGCLDPGEDLARGDGTASSAAEADDETLGGSSGGEGSVARDDDGDGDGGSLAAAGDPQAVGGDRTRMAVATSGYGSTTCYLPSDGVPRCMGYNYGMLGNGSSGSQAADTPEPVIGLDRVRTIVGMDHQFLAVRADGTLWRWGTYYPTPTQFPGSDRFRTMASDGNFTCAVRTDGRVMCQGPNNESGELGNGTTTPSPDVFGLVSNLTDAVSVVNSEGYACALRAAGDVWCWGRNDVGQLGNGDDEDAHVPVQVEGITGAVALATVASSTCALLESGGVSCWGENRDLALGTGNASPTWTTTPVSVVGVTDAVSISAAVRTQSVWPTYCVVRVDGSVKCWGKWYGAPTEHPTLTGVSQLVISTQLGLTALLSDGTAVQTAPYDDPTLTPVPDFDTGMVAPRVVTGLFHSCALRSDGTVACWGDNNQGELGNGTAVDTSSPVDVVGLSDVIDIASTMAHSCAVLRNGTAKCWGRNNEDQLGDGGAAFPFSTTPVLVAGLTGVTAIATAAKSTCAVHESGQVYCWGVNDYGQLGDGTLVDHAAPAPVSGLGDAVAIATSGGHYCVVRASGGVRCWGYGFNGELGNGQTGAGSDSSVPVTVKQNALQSLGGVMAIAGGNATSCAVRANGMAYCWGSDLHGLGNGAAGMSQPYALAVSGITSALDVSMGSSSQCVLLATGTVRCFGTNQYGELGDASAPLGTDQYTPRTVGGLFAPLSGVLAVDSGDDHSCAMLSNGTVKCWGWNSSGQLGDGTTTNRRTPVTVLAFP
jgi:alpha-tubulin suppressor-like RCC1 family protein